ncbi:unnamed protein product [Gongylonema pulchrum]|uniref:Annexin n=1 Tax=Gongylonema pulchrum TaxID=637853 RepID=A0A183DJJ5_9BILA|nr:unnamed protein product [Gongylonema pulchrum]
MCSRTNAQIAELRNVYQQIYGRSLENDLISETSGHFKRLLVSLCAGGRDESMQIDPLRANQASSISFFANSACLTSALCPFEPVLALALPSGKTGFSS